MLEKILGITIILGAFLKFLYPDSIANIIVFFELMSTNSALVVVYIIGMLEFVTSTLFLMGKIRKVVLPMLILFILIYLLISVFGFYYDFEEACGDFSKFVFGRFDIYMILRNLTLLMVSIIVYFYSNKSNLNKTIVN